MEYFKQLITKMPFGEMVRAIMPPVVPILVVWALLIIFLPLITFLPSLTLREGCEIGLAPWRFNAGASDGMARYQPLPGLGAWFT